MDKALLKQIVNRYEAADFVVHRRLNAMIRDLMLESLTIDQFSTLRYLRINGQSTSSELADMFCVGKSSITAITTRLFEKDLIERIPDEHDRRVTHLGLTSEGVRLCEMLEDRVEGLLARFMTKFDQAEALGFIETYEKLASCMLKDGEGAGCESDT
jgi:DNA-binding MarR family transcriptional regulator